MNKRVVFHIGLEKTGTKSLQHFCSANYEVLRSHSVLYPKSNLGFVTHQHSHLAASYLPRDAQSFCSLEPNVTKDQIVASVIREIDETTLDTILISSEFFSSQFGEPEIATLAYDFSRQECLIIAVVRSHLQRLMSAYSTAITSGSHWTFQQFIQNLLDPKDQRSDFAEILFRYPRYQQTLSLWERHFGGNAKVLDYSACSDMTVGVLREIAPQLDVSSLPGRRDNARLQLRLIELTRRVNLLFPPYEDLVARGKRDLWREVCIQRQATLDHILSAVTLSAVDILPDCSSQFALDQDTRAGLDNVISQDRIWLLNRHGIDLT